MTSERELKPREHRRDRFGRPTYIGPRHWIALALCVALFLLMMMALAPAVAP